MGRGKVGKGLARALRPKATVRLVAGRSTPRFKDAAVVILAVPDAKVRGVAERIADRLPDSAALLHCAGSFGAEVFDGLEGNWSRGAMHPLASFVNSRPPPLAGARFVIGGDRVARRRAATIARLVDATPIARELHGPAYHAAAAMVANGTAALAYVGVELLESMGMSRQQAQASLAGLLHTVASNVEKAGVPEALSGPIRRGNTETVTAHRRALAAHKGRFLKAYDQIAPLIIDCAAQTGELSRARLRTLRKLFA